MSYSFGGFISLCNSYISICSKNKLNVVVCLTIQLTSHLSHVNCNGLSFLNFEIGPYVK